ncbi:hypothetical protein FRC08_018211 [Ceratobasidium sp. 394]|nr:hypothetical protein FRC08_018211 [Ceratobasidium sp. 394]
MQRKKTFSRRINYAAVEKLFEEPTSVKTSQGEKSVDLDEGGEKYDDDKYDEGVGGGEMDYFDDGYQEEV